MLSFNQNYFMIDSDLNYTLLVLRFFFFINHNLRHNGFVLSNGQLAIYSCIIYTRRIKIIFIEHTELLLVVLTWQEYKTTAKCHPLEKAKLSSSSSSL